MGKDTLSTFRKTTGQAWNGGRVYDVMNTVEERSRGDPVPRQSLQTKKTLHDTAPNM